MSAFRPALALLLSALLCLAGAAALGEGSGIAPEANTDYSPDLYPYVVHSPSADWYIARADIERLGLEEMLTGLEAALRLQEEDFADARAALAGYLGEVPPAVICTDFCGRASISEVASAYYNGVGNFIKVFHGWEHCGAALLHEYVHYLTFACAPVPIRAGFWAEGVAEYVSRILCKNRLSRAVNMGCSDEETAFFREKGAWDPEEGCIDEKLLYFGSAELWRRGYMVGQPYFAVSNDVIRRTEQIQQAPAPDQLTMWEAASLTAYLAETCGKDAVFSHWDTDPEKMEDVFGRSFREIYDAWALWNTARCAALGISVD